MSRLCGYAHMAVASLALMLMGCVEPSSAHVDDLKDGRAAEEKPQPPPPSPIPECQCSYPQCYGTPLFTDGPVGCEPTIGNSGTSSVSVRMALGETFSVWMGDDLAFSSEGSYWSSGWALTSFSDQVRAHSFLLWHATYIVGASQTDFDGCDDTCVFEPQGMEIEKTLPRADIEVGRTYDVKLFDSQGGSVAIKAGWNDYTNMLEQIDRKASFKLSGNGSAVRIRSTGSEWIIIGSYKPI